MNSPEGGRNRSRALPVVFAAPAIRIIFFTGLFTAVMQTVLLRELLAVAGGNELIIGLILSGWLAATAAGSETGRRFHGRISNDTALFLTLLSTAVIPGIRGSRIFMLPGEQFSPVVGILLATLFIVPPAAAGGWLFGALSRATARPGLYRGEQIGSLVGLSLLAIAVSLLLPHGVIVAAASVPLAFCCTSRWLRFLALLFPLLLAGTDQATSRWKYPVPVERVSYCREGETASTTVDGNEVVFVNGQVKWTGFQTPSAEKAVHTACAMHPKPSRILVINSTGERTEAEKYAGASVECIKTDHVRIDPECRFTDPADLKADEPYDVIIVGGTIPATIAEGRWFTVSMLRQLRSLTGDSGMVTFTLPFTSEIPDRFDRTVRDVVYSTIREVFPFVLVIPEEGLTFVASQVRYAVPDSCRVVNLYFTSILLASLTPQRIEAANLPPAEKRIHTSTHPVLLYAVLDRFTGQFRLRWWLMLAVPLLLTIVLLLLTRPDRDMISIATSGFATGVFSVAVLLIFQGMYGTVYAHVSLLLLSLAAGFTAGGFIRRFPGADAILGIVLGALLLGITFFGKPPLLLFCLVNATAGLLSAAQFVTLRSSSTARKYAADCIGGIIGMAVTSTLLVPVYGIMPVAAGIVILKSGVFLWRVVGRRR